MPKFKVAISIAKYDTVLEAEDRAEAQNLAEEEYLKYLNDNDLNYVEIEEVKE